MQDTQRVAITVQRGSRCDQFELQAGLLRIGSASHCDVRLAPDEAAPEQVLLAPDARGLSICALSAEPPMRLDGAPLTRAVITSGATLELGPVLLTLQVVQAPKRADKQKTLVKNARLSAMLLACAILGYSLLHETPVQSAFTRSIAPPELFAGVQTGCREHEPAAARVLAREQLAAADGKRERSPFSVRDGVLAVPLYATAASCFQLAREPDAAREAAASARLLAAELQQSLQAHQARLEYFLARTRFAAAEAELVALRELVAGRNDAYSQWLTAVARELPSASSNQGKVQP
jgi:hypothetical protein